MPLFAGKSKIHYGWIIVATGVLVLFTCIGLARFAYGVLLPGIQQALHLSNERMGFVGTGNFIGYLIAVLLAPALIRKVRPRSAVAAGLLLIAICLAAMGFCTEYLLILLLYTLVGMGTGFANIAMFALVPCWFRSGQRGKAAGLVICGNGLGIMFAGYLVPRINQAFGISGWRINLFILGAIALGATISAALLLRNHPADLGLEPVGRAEPVSTDQLKPREVGGKGSILLRLGILYLLFGTTALIYGTFIVTTMVREYGLDERSAGFYWSLVGFFSLFSGVGFGTLSDRIGRKLSLSLVFAIQTIAYLLVGLKLGGVFLPLSIALYGVTVFAIPAIMPAAVAEYLGLARAATAFATVTVFFAAGQTLGPAMAGVIAGEDGSFTVSYLLAALLTCAAALFVVTLPAPDIRESD